MCGGKKKVIHLSTISFPPHLHVYLTHPNSNSVIEQTNCLLTSVSPMLVIVSAFGAYFCMAFAEKMQYKINFYIMDATCSCNVYSVFLCVW